jgi:hypothetical protein
MQKNIIISFLVILNFIALFTIYALNNINDNKNNEYVFDPYELEN